MERSEFRNILKKSQKNNIAIIGHMGSGKSIVGKKIALKFGFQSIDSDEEIIKFENKSINDIFYENDEKYFRNIERKILLKLLNKKNVVLSLGGGSILNPEIRNMLKKYSITVFLEVDLKELVKRLRRSNHRPLLKKLDINKKVKELDRERRKYYQLADIKINNTYSISTTINNFIKKFSDFNEKKNSDKN